MGRDERANLRGLPGGLPLVGAGGGRIIDHLPPTVHDIFNRALQIGDIVQLSPHTKQPFEVAEIKAVVESNLPAGLMDITLVCRVKFRAPRGQPNQEFVRCMTAEERGIQPEPQATPGPTDEPTPERPPDYVMRPDEEPGA